MSEADSFQVRVKSAIKDGRYLPSMRRSIQTLVLYEADRCLKHRYSSLRPFQRKYALLATTIDLLGTLDFLNDYQRQEIMFRTNASKEPLTMDLAWRRMKLIQREVNQAIIPKAKELVEDEGNSNKSHDEFCALLLQSMYEDHTENTKPHPPMWEYNHNNNFTVYRVYFRGVALDPNLFPATPPRLVEVPSTKPANGDLALANAVAGNASETPMIPLSKMTIKPKKEHVMTAAERRELLKEVKDHMDLLKSFEDVVPNDELKKRKRALYDALPPVPPPTRQPQKKKAKDLPTAAADTKPAAMDEDNWEKLSEDVEVPIKNFASV